MSFLRFLKQHLSNSRFRVSLAQVLILFVTSLCHHQDLKANGPSNQSTVSCCQSDVWLVNTRCLTPPRCRCETFSKLPLYRYENCRLNRASIDDFVGTLTPDTIVCVFVDGNRISAADALKRGERMRRRIGCCQERVRFVIWSWPTEKIAGPMRDIRTKICRSDGETFFLASWLSQLPTEQRISLVGYSLGARVVTGSLHLLGGGSYYGNRLSETQERSVYPRAALLGSALPLGYITPRGAHGLALSNADRVLSISNSGDQALKFFKFVSSSKNAIALGYRAISPRSLGGLAPLLEQRDVNRTAGRSHDLNDYTMGALNNIRRYALWQPVGTS